MASDLTSPMRSILFLLTMVSIFLSTSVMAKPPLVVASIKPVHSLVASIMKGVGEPKLLIAGEADPHDFSLKPSQAKLLQEAQLVFWIGPTMEEFMTGAMATAGSGVVSIPLTDGHDEHDQNPHIWLDPVLAVEMVEKIATALVKADPANAEGYRTNAITLSTKIAELSSSVEAALANAKKGGFLTYHDAYEHFEKRYGLTSQGSITHHEEAQPGAARIRELRTLIASGKVTCILSEPHVNQQLIGVLTENSTVKMVTIDPSGSTLEAGPDLYFSLIDSVASAFRRCLSE